MRAAVLVLLIACGGAYEAGAIQNDGSGSGMIGGLAPACSIDSDCVPAAARCCDCPTFAMPSDPATDICAGVTCPSPGPTCPTDVHAACERGQCVLACNVVACDATCPDGFALDSNGCQTCACEQVTSRSCTSGSDCTEVPADCCGCALGGSDTAVPSADAAAFEAGLDCPQAPSCPGVSSCQADVGPQCVQGACALVPALPATACGRPDLPACGSGMVCALNADAAATAQGVGACIPAS